MSDAPIIVWFRRDLRLRDHVALTKAASDASAVVPVFVLDDDAPGSWSLGAASRWWLHHSLTALASDLEAKDSKLILRRGDIKTALVDLAKSTGAAAVYTSRAYEPWAADLEQQLRDALATHDVALKRFPGTLLKEPEDIRTQSGDPYKVYTPFWRSVSAAQSPRKPLPRPQKIPVPDTWPDSDAIGDWDLLPTQPDWSTGFDAVWQPGEDGARKRLKAFIASDVLDYDDLRNRPDLDATSRLSPHLHWGELSPAAVWHETQTEGGSALGQGRTTFLKELVWREFSAHLLFHFPTLPDKPFRAAFDAFPWEGDTANLRAWQRGQTGYPIVDAGMRQLWHVGWMHNRVRMIVGSFLIKHLLIDWREGEAWFWDCLVDADLASNSASWQWVAGSGADASPYFRIFNPITQGQKFDPDGVYVRKWVPELAKMPDKYLCSPWEAPSDVLAKAGVRLGDTYPKPLVDHAEARKKALAGYDRVKAA